MNIKRKLKKARTQNARALLNRMPKPPVADGVCACGCEFRPTRGPCPEYLRGPKAVEIKKRCGVCDHDITCHRRKGEPPPTDWDFFDYLLEVEGFPLKWKPPRLLKANEEKDTVHREDQDAQHQHEQQNETANVPD